ncbi:MAG: exosortase [Burkholderiaceae bacterium]|jgi:exosortase B|nr:exosortase [Burkholderiaceae bacterium]
MTAAQITQPMAAGVGHGKWWLPAMLAGSIALAYAPTVAGLIAGPWQTEQEGHGPLIILASLWLLWRSRGRLRGLPVAPAPAWGWASLLIGLVLMFLARTQGVLPVEALSVLPVIVGCVLLGAGWKALRAFAFPIGFLIFAVPAPDWLIDSATVPLKVMISNLVTQVLYMADYPVAHNGVLIMIGGYRVLVKDACSGMNSIFSLSAIGLFYAYMFRRDQRLRGVLLLLSIIPIAIIANFVRVIALVLIAYYGGPDMIEGAVHDMTGIGLFVVALVLLMLFDALLGLGGRLLKSPDGER